jgi:hypothetical protein
MASSSFQGSDTDTFTHTEGSISNNIETPYNDPRFYLPKPENEKPYIFKSGLFTRQLLPIDPLKERKQIVICSMLVFLLFLSSYFNF